MTEEEKQIIVTEVLEQVLVKIPDVLGNLIKNHAFNLKVAKEFFDKHPDLADYRDVVASCVQQVEIENPTMSYDELLKKAVGPARQQAKVVKTASMTSEKDLNLSANGLI